MNPDAADQPLQPGWYEFRLQGRLDTRWSAWLEGMAITPGTNGTTVLQGSVADQSALHGLLARLRDIGLPLLSVALIESDPAPRTAHPDSTTGD